MNAIEVAQTIDHTILKPDATREQLVKLCAEAREYRFASVCVNPVQVSLCRELLDQSGIPVCTVVGFPLGASTTVIKAAEAKHCFDNGAQELDMVINVGALKDGRLAEVETDIKAVVTAAPNALVKVIIEACLLTDEEKVTACKLSCSAGAHFVKTSTGFSSGGATVADIQLMRETVGPEIGVKAAGGIKTAEFALQLLSAGATRLGASAGVQIIQSLTD